GQDVLDELSDALEHVRGISSLDALLDLVEPCLQLGRLHARPRSFDGTPGRGTLPRDGIVPGHWCVASAAGEGLTARFDLTREGRPRLFSGLKGGRQAASVGVNNWASAANVASRVFNGAAPD